jgi:2,5-diketo-D-gluconate reductase A
LGPGVSHFKQDNFEQLKAAGATVVPALNQAELSVVFHDDATIKYCREHGIVYQSYSPLCGGANGSSCTRSGGKNVMTVPEVIAIAKVHGVSPAQIGLKWIVQQGLPLATAIWRLDYMKEDLDLWSWGNLTTAEMAQLSAVAKPDSDVAKRQH